LLSTARLALESWGWPLMVAGACGWIAALSVRGTRRSALALSVVALSYYVFFINAVMYCLDRFLLPIGVIHALFAGWFFDRWLLNGLSPRSLAWRRAVAAAAFAYSLLYAAMLDALMLRDSRYHVERWLRDRAAPGTTIGVNFAPRLQPSLSGFNVREFR